MASGIAVKPDLLRWARGRARMSVSELSQRYPRYEQWERGERHPTMRQLEDFANRTRTPLGYLFLPTPPDEPLPIPDFRTLKDRELESPSPDLLDTIHLMQQRQDWAREILLEDGAEPLPFVGAVGVDDTPARTAAAIRGTLDLREDWATDHATSIAALTALMDAIEAVGVLVMVNGVVGDNTSRPLDVAEFRGFVLNDEIAPLIFVNNRDAKSAQMFTLAHELVHVWLGQGGVVNLDRTLPGSHRVERFCNQVASEFLVPAHLFAEAWATVGREDDRFEKLARRFKVSRIVAARRALDLKKISREAFFAYYEDCKQDGEAKADGGGNYYSTKHRRIGDRFGRLIWQAVRSGRTAYRDAYRLTGLRGKTFDQYMSRFGGRG